MSTALTKFQGEFRKKKVSLNKLLPAHINKERFETSVIMAFSDNPKLLECSDVSKFKAIFQAAELGLDFTKIKGHAYLVPFKGSVVFIPGYRGLIELARRSGDVLKMESRIVYENDEFILVYGISSDIIHKPILKGKRGEIVGAYAVSHLVRGDPIFEFMTTQELDLIRSRSKSSDYGPWKTDTSEMYRKTAIKRLAKYLPISPDLEKAIELDNNALGYENGLEVPVPDMAEPEKAPEAIESENDKEPEPEGQESPYKEPVEETPNGGLGNDVRDKVEKEAKAKEKEMQESDDWDNEEIRKKSEKIEPKREAPDSGEIPMF